MSRHDDDRDRLLAAVDLGSLLVELTGIENRGRAFACPDRAHKQTGDTPPVSISDQDGHGVYYCPVCGRGGSAIDALMVAYGLDSAGAFAELRKRAGVSGDGPERTAPTRARDNRPPEPLPSEADVAGWIADLQGSPVVLERLRELRGWTAESLAAREIGYDPIAKRVAFPIRDGGGRLVNVDRWTPNPKDGEPKVLTLKGRPRDLFPAPETMPGGTAWIVEGSPDAVSGHVLGLPAVAIPGVSWAKKADGEAARFARFDRVYVLLDCDRQGRKAAQTMAAALAAAGVEARILDLDPSRDDGYDLGDFVREAAEHGADGVDSARRWLQTAAGAAEPVRTAPVSTGLRVVNAAAVEIESPGFLEPGRVPLNAVTVLTGDPGLGKSTLTCLYCARTTSGINGTRGRVLMANAEDSPAHVIVPRLAAAGADLSMVDFFTVDDGGDDRPFTLPDDVPDLERHAREVEARLVVLDPLAAFLADSVNTHSDHNIRRALAPLAGMAQRLGIAVVVVAHLNKNPSTDPLYRVGGSIGLVGGARSVLLFARDPDDPDGDRGHGRALGHIKSNWGRLAPTLRYRHEPATVTRNGATVETHRLVEAGESMLDGRSLLSADPDDPPGAKLDRATALLADALADHEWRRAAEVFDRAKRAGISRRTLQRAADMAGVERRDTGYPAVKEWRLPLARQADGAPGTPNPWHASKTTIGTGDLGGAGMLERHIKVDGAPGATADCATGLADDDRTLEHVTDLGWELTAERPPRPPHDPHCPYPDKHAGSSWRTHGGALTCGVCHPPASPDLVAERAA
jgi:hypothetical protein